MDVELPFAHNPNMSYHSLQLYTFHRSDLFSAKLFNNFTYPQNYCFLLQNNRQSLELFCIQRSGYSLTIKLLA